MVSDTAVENVPALVDELLRDPARLARDARGDAARWRSPDAAEEIAEELIGLAGR